MPFTKKLQISLSNNNKYSNYLRQVIPTPFLPNTRKTYLGWLTEFTSRSNATAAIRSNVTNCISLPIFRGVPNLHLSLNFLQHVILCYWLTFESFESCFALRTGYRAHI